MDSILVLIREIPEAKEMGLAQLCEFIEVRRGALGSLGRGTRGQAGAGAGRGRSRRGYEQLGQGSLGRAAWAARLGQGCVAAGLTVATRHCAARLTASAPCDPPPLAGL